MLERYCIGPGRYRHRAGAATTLPESATSAPPLLAPVHATRLHLVTPEIVERTVVQLGMSRVLSEAERVVFDRLATGRRRHDWLAGRIAAKRAVRRAVREAGGSMPAYRAITVWNEEGGAPCVALDANPEVARRWNLSIAHTEGFALAALACTALSGTVGVDIERTKPLSAALIHRVLTVEEAERFEARHAFTPEPVVIWAVKEAALKAGRGQCEALRQIELTWDVRGRIMARVMGLQGPAPKITVTHGAIGAYTVARAFWWTSDQPGILARSRAHARQQASLPAGAA